MHVDPRLNEYDPASVLAAFGGGDEPGLRAAGAHGVMISGRVVQVVVGPSVDVLASELEDLM